MSKITKQSGFSAIELLITLFIAAAFMISGYQLYAVVIKDGGEARVQSVASGEASKYLKLYEANATNPCTPQVYSIVDPDAVSLGLSSATLDTVITCPYASNTTLSKIVVTIKYGSPQKTISYSSLIPNNSTTSTTTANTCPTGFIPVPGDSQYGTSDFCVMKYEAKNNGSGVAVSTAIGTPWVSLTQATATSTAPTACNDCHLITESEWMTIAKNVAGVPSNWSTGLVATTANCGSTMGCYIYSGHNDGTPANALAASTDDNGYSGTGQTSGNQRRTLTLSNGEVIWDLAGNVWEWTQGSSTTGQPGIDGGGYLWREWTAVTAGTITPNPDPDTIGITGSNLWDSTVGVGQIYSNYNETLTKGFARGAAWADVGSAGIFGLKIIDNTPGVNNIGFRVAR